MLMSANDIIDLKLDKLKDELAESFPVMCDYCDKSYDPEGFYQAFPVFCGECGNCEAHCVCVTPTTT